MKNEIVPHIASKSNLKFTLNNINNEKFNINTEFNLYIETIKKKEVSFLGLIKYIYPDSKDQTIKEKFEGETVKNLQLKLDINTINNPQSKIVLTDQINAITILNKFFDALNKFKQILEGEENRIQSNNDNVSNDSKIAQEIIKKALLLDIQFSIKTINNITTHSKHIFNKASEPNNNSGKVGMIEGIISLSTSFVQITSAYENYKNDTSEYRENSAHKIATAVVLLENSMKNISDLIYGVIENDDQSNNALTNGAQRNTLSNNTQRALGYETSQEINSKDTSSASSAIKKESNRKKLLILLAKPLFISFWILSNTIVIGSVATGGYFLNELLINNDLSSKIPNFIRDNYDFIDLCFKNKDFDYFIKNLMPQFNDSEDLMKILNNLNSENKLEFIKHLSDYCKLHEEIQGSNNFLKNFNNLSNEAHKFRIESLLIPIVAASIILAITNVLCYL